MLDLVSDRQRLLLVLRLAAALLVVRVTFGVLWGYHNYFPPNFFSEFLVGRKEYFYGFYQVAFWIHIVFSPLVLFSGLWLLSQAQRQRYPRWHRRLGRAHILLILLLVAPSSLWMSFYAMTGAWAGMAFGLSSVATFVSALMGWRCAVNRHFSQHQIWMTRCFLLLCSAIVLRVLSGAATVLNSDALWTYPLFAWVSAIVPVGVYEFTRAWKN